MFHPASYKGGLVWWSGARKQVLFKELKLFVRKIARVRRWLPLSEGWWAKFDLLRTLVRRDLEVRYKGSVLGNLWPLLNQLSQLLIYTYVFSIVLNVKLSLKGLPANDATFGLWLFAGLLPWIAFSGGLNQATASVLSQPNLVKKVVFPLALLPLVPILSTFIESAFGLMILIVLVAVSSHTLHSTLGLLPLVWLPQLLFTAGLGYLAAGFTVFLRDIPQTLGVILNLWFYLTPITYPASVIPPQLRGWVFWLNPLAAIAEVYRDLVLVGEVQHWGEWGVASAVSVGVFWGGFWCYRRLRPAFADVL
jgi:lipopolysaccharide transport system permease protein